MSDLTPARLHHWLQRVEVVKRGEIAAVCCVAFVFGLALGVAL